MFDPHENGHSIEAKVVKIGPEEAESLLKRNTHNRSLSTSHVKDYKRRMEEGDWHLSTDAIGLDTKGRLVNGQHRLNAIIQSGEEQPFILIEGIDPEAFKWIDEVYKRSLKQSLKMVGYSHVTRLSALVRMLYSWEQGQSPLSDSPSNVQGVKFTDYHSPEIVDSVREMQSIADEATKLWRPSTLNFIYHTMRWRSEVKAHDFVNGVATGLGLTEKNDPRYRLRDRLIEERDTPGGRFDRKLELALSIKACNKYFRSEEVKILRWSPGQGQDFPEPEHAGNYPLGYFE